MADVAAGMTHAEAAERNGIGARTLRRGLVEARPKPKAKARANTTPRALAQPSPKDETAEAPSLLETLGAELRYARDARRTAESDAQRRAWSKRIEDLVRTLERLSPPPPVPPDAVQAELRRLDGITLEIIERFFEEPVGVEEIAS
jgi:hypothetical protein